MAQSFECSMVTPEASVLDAQINYASIPAWDGQIGLAYQRAPLLVKLGDGALRLEMADGSTQWFFVAGGFAQMKDNKLTLLTDEAVAVKDIDLAEAAASQKEAEARVAVTDEDVAAKQRQIERARSLKHLAGKA